MEGTSLLSLPEGMLVEHIQTTEDGLVIEVVTVHPTSCCPLCAETSDPPFRVTIAAFCEMLLAQDARFNWV